MGWQGGQRVGGPEWTVRKKSRLLFDKEIQVIRWRKWDRVTWVPQLVLPLWFLSEALPQGAGSGWNHWSHQKHLDHPLQGQVRWAPQPGLPGPRHRSATPPSCGNGSSAASSPGDQCDTDGMTRDIKETQGFFGHREGRGDLPEAVTAQCQCRCH